MHEVHTSYLKEPTIPILFYEQDSKGIHMPHNAPWWLIALMINNVKVQRVLVDGGASTNVQAFSTYSALGWERRQLKKSPTMLVGFVGESVNAKGCSSLSVTLGEGEHQVTKVTEFVVIDRTSTYNAILGRLLIHELKAVLLTYHQIMKYPITTSIATIRAEQKTSWECYVVALKGSTTCAAIMDVDEAPHLPKEDSVELSRGKPAEELELVPLPSLWK